MKNLFQILFLSTLFVFGFVKANGQNFMGIILLQSTCQDVMKIFKETDCTKKEQVFFQNGERINFFFTSERCQIVYRKKRNVPVGTVLIIVRTFLKKKMTLEELGVKVVESDFYIKETDIVGKISYLKKSRDLEFFLSDGLVEQISYLPKSKYNSKLCKSIKQKR